MHTTWFLFRLTGDYARGVWTTSRRRKKPWNCRTSRARRWPSRAWHSLATMSTTLSLAVKKVPFVQVTTQYFYWAKLQITHYFVLSACRHGSRAGVIETYEGHQGPVTGIHTHNVPGPIDFSHLFLSSSFDWTIKLWSAKVQYFSANCLALKVTLEYVISSMWYHFSFICAYKKKMFFSGKQATLLVGR